MKLTRTLAVGASAAMIALAMSMPAAQAKKVCKPMVWGYGKTVSKSVSKSKALIAWKVNTKGKYGWKYAKYVLAKAKSGKCRKEGHLWHCVRKGKPCKVGVAGSQIETSG